MSIFARAHERVHVRQCEAWGALFVPAYLAASLSAVLCGRSFYFDNRFEVDARNQLGSDAAAQIPSPGAEIESK